MNIQQLLPCPFCGGLASKGLQHGSYKGEKRKYNVIRCKNSKCLMKPETPSYFGLSQTQEDQWPDLAQAIIMWNTRPEKK